MTAGSISLRLGSGENQIDKMTYSSRTVSESVSTRPSKPSILLSTPSSLEIKFLSKDAVKKRKNASYIEKETQKKTSPPSSEGEQSDDDDGGQDGSASSEEDSEKEDAGSQNGEKEEQRKKVGSTGHLKVSPAKFPYRTVYEQNTTACLNGRTRTC